MVILSVKEATAVRPFPEVQTQFFINDLKHWVSHFGWKTGQPDPNVPIAAKNGIACGCYLGSDHYVAVKDCYQ